MTDGIPSVTAYFSENVTDGMHLIEIQTHLNNHKQLLLYVLNVRDGFKIGSERKNCTI